MQSLITDISFCTDLQNKVKTITMFKIRIQLKSVFEIRTRSLA